MDINDDLITFFEWAVMMGVPPSLVPSFQVMQTTLRARSMMVMDMVQKVRPQQEVQLMRDNILIHRMHKLKDKDLPISVRTFIPERYHRYELMRDTNRKIKETTEKLDRIKLQSSKLMEKIKVLNIKKAKIQKKSEDSTYKYKLLEAKLLTLSEEAEKVREQDEVQKFNGIVAPDALNMDEDQTMTILEQAKCELEDFYRNCQGQEKFTKSNKSKAELLCSIRRTLQCLPNLIIFRSINKSITHELDNLLHKEIPCNSNRAGHAEESIAKNISDSYQRFTLRSTQLDSERDALCTITDNYENLYTKMHGSLCNSFPDSNKDLHDEFVKQSAHYYLNEGRIQFLHSEIARNKELLRERSEKMCDMMDSQETIKDIVRKSQCGLASMVSDMKQMQKISGQLNHMRELTEKHLAMMKGQFKPGAKITSSGHLKKYNTCIPDDVKGLSLVDELKLFEYLPMIYLHTLDEGQLFRRHSPIHMYKADVIRASRYAHLYTVEGFIRQVHDICNLQMYLTTLNRKREFTMEHISVFVDDIRKKEFEQNKSIYRLLQFVDYEMQLTTEIMDKTKVYYNFLMLTPMKNYISPCNKIEGKTFNQMENEFLLYYRMVRGGEKTHEEME